jgi:competence protein ComEA
VIRCSGAAVGEVMSRDPSNLAVSVVGVAVLTVIAGVAWFGVGADGAPPISSNAASNADPTPGTIRIHVSGAVTDPGVVQVAADAIVADAVVAAGGAVATADLASINLAAPLRAGERIVVPDLSQHVQGVASGGEDGIDINTATATQLEELPGVGPVLAQRIVDVRSERGPFLAVEDLLDVSGIGEAKLSQMRDAISYP